jgi:hypothetical protein
MENRDNETVDARAVRLNITVKPETKVRLDEARNKKGIELNVSQVCDRAINAELDRCEKPGLVDLLARLRIESDRRRGAPYRMGHQAGQAWARRKASWAEICHYAQLGEDDVRIGDIEWSWKDGRKHTLSGFVGQFRIPDADYPLKRPQLRRGVVQVIDGAPSFPDPDDLFGDTADWGSDGGRWVDDVNLCDQYWRGWLAGVQEVFHEVSPELEPIRPAPPYPVAAEAGEDAAGLGNVDPDDIPF